MDQNGTDSTRRRQFAGPPSVPSRLPDGGGVPGADLGQRIIDYVAGMTDRYCVRIFEELTIPESFAL
jgi:dGTPase